jgi:hypothetical protein
MNPIIFEDLYALLHFEVIILLLLCQNCNGFPTVPKQSLLPMSITTLSMGVFRERPKLLFGALGVVIPSVLSLAIVKGFRFHENWGQFPPVEQERSTRVGITTGYLNSVCTTSVIY